MSEIEAIHEPRCNTECQPGAHHLTSGVGYPHIHRTDLSSVCGDCRRVAEEGRRLASERDDLIAAGADPDDLLVPIHPEDA